jgi:cell wall-associated NlpC family hydrolase
MAENRPTGQIALVAVSVSTAWTSPEAPRPCDAPAIAAKPDVARWVAQMTTEERLGLQNDKTLTQLLLGDRVLIDEVVDGWTKIVAPDQPCPHLDRRGYIGWIPSAHLAPHDGIDHSHAEVYIVNSITSTLLASPDGKPTDITAVLGTRLTVAGPAKARYLPVIVPGRAEPLWATLSDLVTAPTQPPTAADVLDIAERLVGVPYIWGGASSYGIDCSGLVYLAHRHAGFSVPRDADDQAEASRALGSEEEAQPGDLHFFARPDSAIHHVGIVRGDQQTLHASGTAGRVQHDVIAGELANTLVATHRTVR